MTQDEVRRLIDQAGAEGWTELDLAGMGLTELPEEIGTLTQLETLILGKVEKWEWVDNKPVPTLITNKLTQILHQDTKDRRKGRETNTLQEQWTFLPTPKI